MWVCEKDFSKALPWENPMWVNDCEWAALWIFTCYLQVISSWGNKMLFGSRLWEVSKALQKQKEKNLVTVSGWESVSHSALPLWSPCCTSVCTISTILCQRLWIPAEGLGEEAGRLETSALCSCIWLTGRASEWVKMRQFCLEHRAWRHCRHDKERNLQAPLQW